MNINLAPNDPAGRLEFVDSNGESYLAQVNSIKSQSRTLTVTYSTEKEVPHSLRFALNEHFAQVFLPRLYKILVEHGFHSGYLPTRDSSWIFTDLYANTDLYAKMGSYYFVYDLSREFWLQIAYACYDDGQSLRAALKFQTELNKT